MTIGIDPWAVIHKIDDPRMYIESIAQLNLDDFPGYIEKCQAIIDYLCYFYNAEETLLSVVNIHGYDLDELKAWYYEYTGYQLD